MNYFRYIRATVVQLALLSVCAIRLCRAAQRISSIKVADEGEAPRKALTDACTQLVAVLGRLAYLALPASVQGHVLSLNSVALGFLRNPNDKSIRNRLLTYHTDLFVLAVRVLSFVETKALDAVTFLSVYSGHIPEFSTSQQESWVYALLDHIIGNCRMKQYLIATGGSVGTGVIPITVDASAVTVDAMRTLYDGDIFGTRSIPDDTFLVRLEAEFDNMLKSITPRERTYMVETAMDLGDLYSGRRDNLVNEETMHISTAIITFVDTFAASDRSSTDVLPELDREMLSSLVYATLGTIEG